MLFGCKTNTPLPVSLKIKKINEFTGHKSAIYDLAYDEINNVFYSVSGDGYIVCWPVTDESADGKLIGDSGNKLFAVAFEPTSQLLISGDIDGNLYWINPKENKILSKSSFHKGSIFDLCFLSSEKLLSVSSDGFVCLWNTITRKPEISIRLSFQGLRSIKHDIVNHRIYIGASDNNIYILDANTFETVKILQNAHRNSVFAIETLNSDLIISGGRDAHLNTWNQKDFTQNVSFSAHWFTINKIIELPYFTAFATASRDKTIRIWDSGSLQLLKSIDVQKGGHINSVNSLLWIPESNFLLSAGDDRIIKLFKIYSES